MHQICNWAKYHKFTFYVLTFEKMKIQTLSVPQNNCLNLVLVKDINMIKPIVDKRLYRVIKLANDMEVTLISDKNSENCGASMSIGLGYLQEDGDVEGFIHLLEHLVISGSKKYPSKNLFESHLATYYGETNSSTEEEKINFSFSINWKGFEKALEIFSHMFTNSFFLSSNTFFFQSFMSIFNIFYFTIIVI